MAHDDYYGAVISELSGICDDYFPSTSDKEFELYCRNHNVPFEQEEREM